MFKKVALNTLVQGLGKIIVLVLSLLTTGILTRTLGLGGYGEYAFITALILFFGTVSDWGTNIIAVREASQRKDERPEIFGSTVFFRLLLAGIALALVNLLIRVNPDWRTFTAPVTIGSFVLLALSLKTSLGAIFQTLLRYDLSVIVEIASSLLFLLLVLFSLSLGITLSAVIFSWLLATAAASLVGLFFARRLSPVIWGLNPRIVRRIFWEAAPAGALFLFFNLYNRIDTVLLQYFKGAEAVGIYGLAYKIYDNLVVGAAFLMNAMFPLVSAGFAAAGKGLRTKTYYQKSFDLLLGGGLAVFFVFFFLSPFLIKLLGGNEFLPAAGVLRILLFATVISYINHLTGYSLIAFGRQKTSMFIALAALVLNVLGNLLFIPLYSYTAAAVITIATEGFVLVLSIIAIRKTLGIFPSLFSFPKSWAMLLKRKADFFD